MIDTYIKEFLAIVSFLMTSEQIIIKGDYLIVDKEIIIKLLKKNAYETVENKLKIWRDLNWIAVDPGRLTKRIKKNGNEIPTIKIRYQVYETLEKLLKK